METYLYEFHFRWRYKQKRTWKSSWKWRGYMGWWTEGNFYLLIGPKWSIHIYLPLVQIKRR